ncbi:MAG TPA: DUF1249 domain-containing protein [Steroidobacteraceae bacterium]|nr:DUF1249 domain-containing protein [Steroidobacteraceae bacterium]
MFDDTATIVSWRARPRSFAALMGLYESNYIRLAWLTGPLAPIEGAHRSVVAGDCDLLLSVRQRSPYTTTLQLSYLIADAGQSLERPDMRVRVYHDARLAEAQSWEGQAERGGRTERELHQCWARNVMLNKWLEYCVERGHRFSAATRSNA